MRLGTGSARAFRVARAYSISSARAVHLRRHRSPAQHNSAHGLQLSTAQHTAYSTAQHSTPCRPAKTPRLKSGPRRCLAVCGGLPTWLSAALRSQTLLNVLKRETVNLTKKKQSSGA